MTFFIGFTAGFVTGAVVTVLCIGLLLTIPWVDEPGRILDDEDRKP